VAAPVAAFRVKENALVVPPMMFAKVIGDLNAPATAGAMAVTVA
jgi:hypothetical protein